MPIELNFTTSNLRVANVAVMFLFFLIWSFMKGSLLPIVRTAENKAKGCAELEFPPYKEPLAVEFSQPEHVRLRGKKKAPSGEKQQ